MDLVDREKLSAIAHRQHVYCNPFAPERIERIIELLRLAPDDRAVDFGCGKAELAIRLIERFEKIDKVRGAFGGEFLDGFGVRDELGVVLGGIGKGEREFLVCDGTQEHPAYFAFARVLLDGIHKLRQVGGEL